MIYRVLDLCAGAAGGWSLGLHRAGMKTVAACEAVDWRRDMFAANFPGVKLYDDLRTLTGAQVRADTGDFPEILAGSPVCKEYSPVGRGGGLDADDLFIHAVRLADEGRPHWCAFENSHFLKTRGYDRISSALEAIGYAVWPLVVGAGNAGAAHRRPRAFILARDTSRPQGRFARQPRANAGVGGRPDPRSRPPGGYGPGASELLVGPAGSQPLGCHLREWDGVSAGVAEQAREAYGDAVLPQLTEAVGRAILQVDAAMAGGER